MLLSRDVSGHWLVSSDDGKPVALFYAHNVQDHIAKRRAEKFIGGCVRRNRADIWEAC